ncbi:uncharacterized protein LOC131020733 [Salvia miltiorrhiza]|uniref:uncharacterized protein LOC131020733 n=1 Tax=Salvia miltiorrhiza TaxID=226208 RepID=UPI0025ACE5EC|nr:uncharacterized protein LOC131020733 [Salvia miltiorrhiza]
MESPNYEAAIGFMERAGMGGIVGAEYNVNDSFSTVVGGALKLVSTERAKICCILHVKPPILNANGILFGGAVAAVAERVAIGCAATILGHSQLCVGEFTISYLAPAPPNAEIIVNASVINGGRNVAVVALDFRLKESQRLAYVSRVTLYKIPLSNL